MPEVLKDGRFVLLASLGEGAQGHTFDAVDKREGRAVAIKRFDVRGAKTWKDAELAERETRVLQSLSHPRLPRYYDHFEENGALYLVMEKIEGESLSSLQKRGAILSEADVVRLIRDASEVLDYLHGRVPPVIHRDLKPGNVLRRPDGSFAFVDFGAVRDKLRPEGGSTVVGTFGYMAPEQFQGRALPASDVYSVGATALSLLTGQQPETLPHKGLAIDVRGALGHRARSPLADVLTAMLNPDPDRRPSRLAPLLAKLGSGAPKTESRRPAPQPGRRERHVVFERGRLGMDEWRDALSQRFEAQAREYEERALEYERRAAAGGPGARGWQRSAEGWRRGARKWRQAAEHARRKAVREAEHQARRQARHLAKNEARRARIEARHADGYRHGPPWPVALLLALLFTVGIMVVAITNFVVVPLVLRTLSMFFAAAPLRRAAVAVQDGGKVAIDNMERSRRWFLSGGEAPAGEGVRVDARARVAEEPRAEEDAGEVEAEAEADQARR